ncbi:MAG: tetratricopeptide repeat protein [Flavipsychrobacter sp.]
MQKRLLIRLVLLLYWLSLSGSRQANAQNISEKFLSCVLSKIPPRPDDTINVMKLITHGSDLVWSYPDSAMKLFQLAKQQSVEAGYVNGVIESLRDMAHVYAAQTKYSESFACYNQAITYSHYINDKSKAASIYTDIATTYMLESNYPNAAHYYYAAFKVLKDNGYAEQPGILVTYANLAYLQSRLGRYDLALEYLDKAENIARKKKYYSQLAFILNNKGEAYRAINKPQEALNCYTVALSIYEKKKVHTNQETEVQQSLYISMGVLSIQQDQLREAILYLNKAKALSSSTSPYYASIFPNYLLGKAYFGLKEYSQAKASLIPALEKARQMNFKEDMPDALKTLSAIYEAENDYYNALRNYQKYARLKDTLLSEAKTKEINQLELKYRTAQKDKELAGKQLLILKQQNQLMGKNTLLLVSSICILILLIGGLLLLIRYRNNQHYQRLQAEQLKNMSQEIDMIKQDEEIKVMQAVMKGEEGERERIARELHDGVGGMLAAIRMHFSKLENGNNNGRAEKIIEMLNDTATEIRKTAHNLMPDVVLQHTLVDALQTFIANINAGSSIKFDLQVHGNIESINKTVELSIYRIIQELVHNVIKHSAASYAAIQLSMQERSLLIMVEDNGMGFDKAHIKAGLGLHNINSRVELLDGHFSIDSVPDCGTTCYIEFDLEVLKKVAV